MLLLAGTNISYEFYSDLTVNNLASLIDRTTRRLAVWAKRRFNIQSKLAVGYGAIRLQQICVAYAADLYIMHQDLPTIVGAQMAGKFKVAFDFEDWYSEDIIPKVQSQRPIKLLKQAEKTALEKGVLCYTTSKAMADGLASHYGTAKTPSVIYNSFPANEATLSISQPQGPLRFYWFSQTIGEGRGLEFFIACMAKSKAKMQLVLRGNVVGAYQESLKKLITEKDEILFLPLIDNHLLLADMANYDAGLALEPDTPPNKNLTISNKLFHYMAAGLPIIASYTKGQAEIAEQHPEYIFMYPQNDTTAVANILDTLGEKFAGGGFAQLKEAILANYNRKYSWNLEAKKLLKLVEGVFNA